MDAKVSMRYLNKLFSIGKKSVRIIFAGQLSSDTITALSERFPTLGKLSEATDKEILSIPGIGEKTLQSIKDTLNDYYYGFIIKDILSGMPKKIPTVERIAWGNLIDEAELYSYSVKKIKKAIKKLPKKERKFLKMSFSLKKMKHTSNKKISEKMNIPLSEINEYRLKVLNHLSDIIG